MDWQRSRVSWSTRSARLSPPPPLQPDTVEPAMSSHPCDTIKVVSQDRWLLIGSSFVYKMSFWGMTKWPPIGGWLLIRVAAHSRFYCTPQWMSAEVTTQSQSLDGALSCTTSKTSQENLVPISGHNAEFPNCTCSTTLL